MPTNKRYSFNFLKLTFLLSIFWELFIFIRLPKQAFIQGLLESWLVSQGLIFYKDFGGYYLPFLRMLMVPLHNIFGYSQYTTIILAPITSLLVLFVLFRASQKWLKGWFRVVPLLFFSIWHTLLSYNHFEATAFLGLIVLISVVFWLLWWDEPTSLKSFFIGLFSAFGVFSLQIVLPFYLILNLSFLLKYKELGFKRLFNLLFISLIGFLIPTIIITTWFLLNGALDDLYNATIAYHFTNYPYSSLGKGEEIVLVFLSIHIPVILLLTTLFRNSKNIALLLMTICLPITFWFAIFHPLRFEISLPIFSLIFGLGLQDAFKKKSRIIVNFSRILLISILVINFYTLYKYKLSFYREKVFNNNHSQAIISKIYPDDPMYDTVEWIKKNSNPKDKIFVMGDALLYVETKRLPSNRRAVASEPFVYTPFEKFKEEIEQDWPSFWVVDERLWKRFEDFGYRKLGDDFQRLIERDPIVKTFDYWTIRKH